MMVVVKLLLTKSVLALSVIDLSSGNEMIQYKVQSHRLVVPEGNDPGST